MIVLLDITANSRTAEGAIFLLIIMQLVYLGFNEEIRHVLVIFFTVLSYLLSVLLPALGCYLVIQHPDKLAKIEKAWREKINNTMYMTISKPFFLEFMNKDVDKSKSIERLADMLGISMSHVIAVGDSYNDLSMIKSAGLGVAMGNAVELVKDNADYITADNDHDGIVMVINKFVLSQK